MPYLPHAVMASVRDLAGRVVAVRLRDLGVDSYPRYQLLLDVELTQHPSRAVVRGVKFYAPLTITLPGGNQKSTPRGKYDDLIEDILVRLTPAQRSLAKVEEYLNNQLKNTPVMLQTIGGVWTISQI